MPTEANLPLQKLERTCSAQFQK